MQISMTFCLKNRSEYAMYPTYFAHWGRDSNMQAVIIVVVVKDSSAIDNTVFHIIVIFGTIENTKKDSTTVDGIMKDGTVPR